MGDVNTIYRGQASLDSANLELIFRIFPLLSWRFKVSIQNLWLFQSKKKKRVLCYPQFSLYAFNILLQRLDTFTFYVHLSFIIFPCQISLPNCFLLRTLQESRVPLLQGGRHFLTAFCSREFRDSWRTSLNVHL